MKIIGEILVNIDRREIIIKMIRVKTSFIELLPRLITAFSIRTHIQILIALKAFFTQVIYKKLLINAAIIITSFY